ncbi:uncharacterized protein LOC128276853 [Anopheles cruzii]|uniref:uncharacterized protein LOC128276853 n=1 Tax=Anopheles cruzii TaxID=68878 RepID=UPI0022EC8F1D|nr:uncharacterized protein LOC128276853 [Anopheles cruzii]
MFQRAIKSLELVELDATSPGVLLENLLEVAPRLNCLKVIQGQHDHLELQFICEKFSYLQHLEVDVRKVTAADNFVRFDGLAHLQELKLWGLIGINYIHPNNVRCLTISYGFLTDDDLIKIPEKFPLLKRLILDICYQVSRPGIERLHKLIPSCRIDCYEQRFYPVDNSTSN